MAHSVNHNDQLPQTISPLTQIEQALGYGVSLWHKINHSSKVDRPQLLTLTFLLEAYTESLFDLYMLNGIIHKLPCNIIRRLSDFYSQSTTQSTKRGSPINQAIKTNDSIGVCPTENYYAALPEFSIDEDKFWVPTTNIMRSLPTEVQDDRKPSPKPQRPTITATFPEDLGISAVTSFMARQQNNNEMEGTEREEDPSDSQPEYHPSSTNTTIVSQELPSVRFRLNLIRHKYATTTELTTLQLFRSFATAAKKTDKTMVFLPVDSTKQSLSPLSSQKQIDNITPNQLRLYFSPYYKDQHHSISGFIHIVTSLTLDDLGNQLPLAEWLQTYQYSIVPCKSQEEEMSLAGVLCYGSLFLHRDSLLKGIMAHPNWIALNSNLDKPIVIDLVVKPFKCPGKSEDMIFVRTERSKKEVVQTFFLELYDGTPKKYPRGDMLFFIPITSKLDNDYTDEQRLKYLFNHSTFIGDEDCMSIHGLASLDNEVILKDGSTITVRTLLKSLPASPGMSRSRLFQVVDPNSSKECVLVTFQRIDKHFIEDRLFTLEKELMSHLAPGQSSQVLENEFEKLQYVPTYHKNKGKVIRVHHPTKSHQDFIKHADSIMSSPPKKRTHSAAESNQTKRSIPLQPLQVSNIAYSGAVQAQTTRTKSVIQPDGTRTTTTTKMSQTVTASMEARFETIEREQHYMKQRITGVETRTATISDNIQAMMEHWKIAPTHYKRKPETELDDSGLEERDMEQANHSMSLVGSPPPSHKPRQVSSFISEARLSKSQSSSKSYNTPQERDEDALSSGEASDKALVVLAPTQAFRVKRVKKLLATRKILHATTSDYYQTLATITSSPFNYYIIHQPTAQPLNNYINTTLTGGGTVIEIVGINNHSQRKSWYPQRTFPVVRSSHPLDVACGVDLLQQIQQACRKDFTEIVARHPTHPPLVVSVKDMRRLISYSSPISDSIMSLYLEKLTLTYGISYLATSFLHTLRSQGWTRLLSYFALYRNRPRSNSRPLVQGESAIILPCFVDGCHWVIVVRREIEGHVKFYYADDLNNGNTETDIKNLLSNNTSQEFYPPSASWTRCLNYTYRPHSNECGPRSLLAATILALHPDPSSNVLLPIMHKNLAQITRTWIAGQLIQENIDIEAIKNCIRATPTLMPLSTSSPSSPADLIQWKPGTEQNALSPNTSMKKKIQSLFPPLEHTIQKNPLRPLNPLAPIFIPSQTKDKEENKKHEAMSTLPRYRTNNQLLLTTTETTTSTASKKKKYVAPARRMETLLPGQTTLTRFFQCSKTSKAPIVPPLLSLPETNKTYSQDTVQSVSQTPPPIPQSTKSVQSPMQRTLFDFQFFKPYATISESDPNTWGHTPESIDTSTTFRLLFQNPNGIKPTVTEPDFLFSLHLCQEIGVAAICLAETNLNWNHSQHHVSLRRCLFRNWKSAKFQTSVPEEKFLGNYQPGGTATIVTDRWTSRVIKSGSDPLGLGRWSFIILRGKQDTSICVITAYRVCKDKTTGPKTAYQQQKRHLSSLLRTQGKVSTVDPHRQFILDLQAWITSKQAEGMQIILSLDNNEELMQNKGQLSPSPSDLTLPIVSASHDGTLETLVRSTGLVDVLRHKHPSDSYPPTYNRGKKRIDYILVSASLLSTVTRSGILPYNAVFQGDHRPCFIDIDVSLAFDGKIAEISPPCQRHLQLHDPRLVTKYLEVLSKQFQLHSIPEKVAALKQQSKTEWSEEKLLTYERLDASITQSMLYAERQTSKRYTKRYEWSPTLIKAVYAERYWRLMLRRSQGRQVSNELLQRTRLRADIPPTQHLYTLPEIISCLAAARQSRKSLQNDHHTLRQNYLEKLAAALVIKRAPYLEENPQYNDRLTKRTAKEVKRLIRLERKRYLYRIIGFTLNATTVNSTGLTHIDVPAASDSSLTIDPKTWKGPWRSVTDPEEIVHYICRMNTAQYHQAVTTPFGSGYLADTIGFNIDKPGAADILNGTFEISPSANLLPETKRILKFLQEPCHSTPDLPSEITPEEFKSTYKIVKERTSSSVSGRHVGHYKAAAQDLTITIVHATMMSLPFLVGFSPTRWRKVVDVMLEKEPGNPKLHRLRIIALIESDYNQSQRILVARRLSHRMEDLGIIPEMQYGSRPGKLCVSPVLNKQLTHDVIRQTKHTAAIIENDAVGCYDRLVNPLVLLAMRRMGVPETSARSIAQTWSGTTHSIKTQYGLSSATYQNTSTTPLFGPGQGSTTGPTLWQITFVLLEDSALGQEDDNDVIQLMHLESANGDLQLDNPGEAFVDDSNLGSTSSLPIVPHHGAPVDQLLHCKSAITNLHHLAQRWERALFSTGGAINFGKSFWFAFHWRWKNGVATIIPTLDTMTLELTEGDTLEKPILVPKKSVFDTYRTLGVHISPSGDTSAAVKVLLTKATQYQSKIATSHLPKEAALLSYTMFLLPQLGYPLPAMTLSEADCHTIQSPTLMALLPKLHLNRHIARSIVFGPHLYGGMSLKSLYFIQSIGQLTLFKGHIRGRDKSNKLLRISLSYLQLAVGSITSVLQLDAVKYSAWMENTWLLSFWKFLSKINLKVQLQDQWLPSVTREHDIALMDFFITQGYKNSQLGRLNRCRIYLQVITLADITSASGSNIIPDILSGIPLIDRKSHLQWPCQQRPPQGDWTLWAQALRPLQPRSTLLQPLGQWLTSTTHQTWFWFMDPSNSLLYQCDPSLSRWIAYRQAIQPRRRTRSQSSFFYDVANGSSSTAPEGHLLRTTICHDRYTGLSTAIAGPPTPTSPTPPAIPQPIYALIRTTEFFQPMMPIDLPHEEVLAQLAASRNSALYAVSRTHWDTSFVTYAWALFTQHPNNLKTTGISNKGLIPNVSSARRTELEGILQVIFLLHTICHYHRMSQGSVTILCFSKSLASSLRKLKFSGVSSALCDHGDIMTSLRYYICNFPTNINISFEHFDMTKPSAKVAFADQTIQYLAKLIASTRESTKDVVEHCQYIPPPHSEITLSYQGVPLLTNIRSTLRNLLHKDQITSTICKQEGWSEQLFHQVDWEAHEFALLRTWSCKRIAYIKLSHALLNTNVQNRKFYRKSDLCPCCAGHPETLTHVFTCQSPEVAEFRTKQQEILWHNLSLIQTPDEILDAIKLGILSLNREPTSKDTCPPVFQHQSRLGWEAFLRGRISFMWRSAFNPDADFDDKNSKKWAGQLTVYLLQYSQQLWTFRCGVLKGHNKEENRQKHREELLNQVQSAYEEFAKDPFHIPSDWRHMFHRPFLSLVQSDRDTLACWLRSYSEACQQQMLLTQQHQRHSVAFFSPFRREYQPHPNRESRSCIIVSSSDNSDRSSISSDAETYCPDDSNLSQSNDSRDDIYDLGDDEESLVSIDSSILQYAPFSCSATPHPR